MANIIVVQYTKKVQESNAKKSHVALHRFGRHCIAKLHKHVLTTHMISQDEEIQFVSLQMRRVQMQIQLHLYKP